MCAKSDRISDTFAYMILSCPWSDASESYLSEMDFSGMIEGHLAGEDASATNPPNAEFLWHLLPPGVKATRVAPVQIRPGLGCATTPAVALCRQPGAATVSPDPNSGKRPLAVRQRHHPALRSTAARAIAATACITRSSCGRATIQ